MISRKLDEEEPSFGLYPKHLALWVMMPLALVSLNGQADEWYKGDLHSHSSYSDGDSSVADVIASAELQGLDFLAITDHDTDMSGNPTHWFDPSYVSDRMALLYGVEWTTGRGHANLWWPTAPSTYAPLWEANQRQDVLAAVAAAHAGGALFSINHPAGNNSWQYPLVLEGTAVDVDCIEVWNGPTVINRNDKATYENWDNLLLQGRRITGVGGSDTHDLEGLETRFVNLGRPTTWVYAQSKSAHAILAGIEAGHVSISYAPDTVRLDFNANADGDGDYEIGIGDNVLADGNPVHFRIRLSGAQLGNSDIVELPSEIIGHVNNGKFTFSDFMWLISALGKIDSGDPQLLLVVRNATILKGWLISEGTEEIGFTDLLDGQSYYRVELYGEPKVESLSKLIYGTRIAATNPVYVNY